jgi:hypothetical protein
MAGQRADPKARGVAAVSVLREAHKSAGPTASWKAVS